MAFAAAPAQTRNPENIKNVLVFTVLQASAPFSRGTKTYNSRRNVSEHGSKIHEKQGAETHPRNIRQSTNNNPKWLPKSIPEASGGLFGARLAPRGAENRFRRPPGAQKNSFGDPKRRQERFLSDFLRIGSPNGEGRRQEHGPSGRGFGESKLRLDVVST